MHFGPDKGRLEKAQRRQGRAHFSRIQGRLSSSKPEGGNFSKGDRHRRSVRPHSPGRGKWQSAFYYRPRTKRIADSLTYEFVAGQLWGSAWEKRVAQFPAIRLKPNDYLHADFR